VPFFIAVKTIHLHQLLYVILRQTVTTPVNNVIHTELEIYSSLYKSCYTSLQQKLFHAILMCHSLTHSSPNI